MFRLFSPVYFVKIGDFPHAYPTCYVDTAIHTYIVYSLSIKPGELDMTGAVCINDGREILRIGDKLEPSPVSPPDNGVLARECGLSRSSSDDVDQSEWTSCEG